MATGSPGRSRVQRSGLALPLRLALLVLALPLPQLPSVHEPGDRVAKRDVEEQHQHREERRDANRALEDQDQQDEEDRRAERRAPDRSAPGRGRLAALARLLSAASAASGASSGLLAGAGTGAPAAIDAAALGTAVLPAALLRRSGHALECIRRDAIPVRVLRIRERISLGLNLRPTGMGA